MFLLLQRKAKGGTMPSKNLRGESNRLTQFAGAVIYLMQFIRMGMNSPHSSDTINQGLVKEILRQAGISNEEWGGV